MKEGYCGNQFTVIILPYIKSENIRQVNNEKILVSETTRSLGGLTTTTKSPDADGDGLPEVSTREIVHNAGTGSTTTNTAPDNSITITATFLDGNTKAVSGSAVTNNGGRKSIRQTIYEGGLLR